ncbi:HNH endonuclease [Geobacillus subterraneus]|uniref:HNH endonuclease n=1 Tax=Geobacillus subterraneus TaxID=129338 RepID=UPI00155204B9|nr:HNH endonuclease [Geobacillus subterraneus]
MKKKKKKQRHRLQRGNVSKREREKAFEAFGVHCVLCEGPSSSLHHVKFRKDGGRGVWRNLAPLCQACHENVHRNEPLAQWLQREREERFGPYYWMDRFDLYEQGLLSSPKKDQFERYMNEQETKRT